MLVKVQGAALQGIDAIVVTVEVAVDRGASFSIVGLPDTAVKESSERVRSAIKESGLDFPHRSIVVNMAPADVKKEGAAYDLPIALAILAGNEQITLPPEGTYMLMGELSLDGSLRPIKGALPMAILARQLGFKGLILPADNATEAAAVNNLNVYGARSLMEVIDHISGRKEITPTVVDTRAEFARAGACIEDDFVDVVGQENVKRAFEVACAGGHNILLVGPPGSGKSMMAKRLPGIMPPLTLHEALETTKIHSVAGKIDRGTSLMAVRPFRAPHHTISPVALVGGGNNPHPGEISLAHNGILFLDEFPEYSRSVLEVLRQPLEDRVINISRAKYSVTYPAGFMLVASMNPCPCGYYNHPTKPCTCAPGAVSRYLSRVSGPMLDRIDLQVEILPVPFKELTNRTPGEHSADIRARVVRARQVQQERFKDEPSVHCNAQMNSRLLRRWVQLTDESRAILEHIMTRYDMSARAYDRILRVARTIADLENSATLPPADDSAFPAALAAAAAAPVQPCHIAEATAYRNLDRSAWGQVKIVK